MWLIPSSWICIHVLLNSLWPNDAIWLHRSRLTLAQVMACCLTAPSHHLNQCWLIISKVRWHSVESNLTRQEIVHSSITRISVKIILSIFFKSRRSQWVKRYLLWLYAKIAAGYIMWHTSNIHAIRHSIPDAGINEMSHCMHCLFNAKEHIRNCINSFQNTQANIILFGDPFVGSVKFANQSI